MLLSRYLFEWMLTWMLFCLEIFGWMLTWMLFYLWKYLAECYFDAFCLCFKCLKVSLKKIKLKTVLITSISILLSTRLMLCWTCSKFKIETPPSRHLHVQSQRWNTKILCEIGSKLVSLLVLLDKLHKWLWCFPCCLWTSKFQTGGKSQPCWRQIKKFKPLKTCPIVFIAVSKCC